MNPHISPSHPSAYTHTPTATFEGRPLERPHEDVEDQGLHFDLATIENRISRRKLFGSLGLGAGAAALAACIPGNSAGSARRGGGSAVAATTTATTASGDTADLTEMKTETAGPYPGDGSNGPDVLEKVGVERRDIRSSIGGGATASGVPMTLRMNIIDMLGGNAPMTGAAVYVWNCDAEGRYSMYSSGVEDETYLRGVQVTGDDGSVEFTSIIPGCYDGRWPHIHFEVFPDVSSISDASNALLTSQIAIPEEVASAVYETSNYSGSSANLGRVSLDSDNVFGDGYSAQLPHVSGTVEAGYALTIDVPIDTSTENVDSSGGAGGPGGAPGGGPGAPGASQ
ncbi:MAG TPA: intradiol ring-cleavage dioxygenase [Candidatus Corynebacterium gallistercoris]|uniref:Intradiol ring-cleavage dioxygenase n=1 Tax=Candidatus Corynebacterium gallistercoris TaxID=2838530 RepID=A0A9D1UQ85_9CORY|nr:intradiol ring-cleavage dioxygenase [Candidatus Corynebacterium gallistercoris]